MDVVTAGTEQIRALAEEATPGPWTLERGSIAWMIRERERGPQVANVIVDADAAYIAALDPQTVSALLDVVDAARVLCDDEESGVDGFGPDVTHIRPLRSALTALDNPSTRRST